MTDVNTVPTATPKPRRRWLQFSLRTLLVLMLVFGCGFGWLAADESAAQRAVEEFLQGVKSDDLTRQNAARRVLSQRRDLSKDEVVTILKRAIDSEDARSVYWCARALQDLGVDACPDARRLGEIILNKDRSDRGWAILFAGSLGSRGAKAAPALAKVVEDDKEDWNVRIRAADALGGIGGQAKEHVRVLVNVSGDPSDSVYPRRMAWATETSLKRILGPEAVDLSGKLVADRSERLKDRIGAIRVLGCFFRSKYLSKDHAFDVSQAEQIILRILGDESENASLRCEAAKAISGTRLSGNVAAEASALLAKIIAKNERSLRDAAIAALEGVGSEGFPVVRSLLRTGDARDFETVCGSLRGIVRWGESPDASPLLPAVISGLDRDNPQCKRAAIAVLDAMGSKAMPAIPALSRMENDPNRDVREDALNAFRNIDPSRFRSH